MALSLIVAALVVSSTLTDAFVDRYVYHFEKTEATKNYLNTYASSYYTSRDQLLAGYTGPLADTCRSQLEAEAWPGSIRVLHQNLLINLVGQVKTLDTNWFNAKQECGQDQTCIDVADDLWTNNLEELKTSAEIKIDQINNNNLDRIRTYMDNCTTQC